MQARKSRREKSERDLGKGKVSSNCSQMPPEHLSQTLLHKAITEGRVKERKHFQE